MINGVPEPNPDLVYNGYGGSLAVAGDGTLYSNFHQYRTGVFAFPPNSNQPDREITIPEHNVCFRRSGGSAQISALAADAAGYLFVGIYTTGTFSRPERHKGRSAKFPKLCEDVAVYTPTANGNAVPIQLIHFPRPDLMQSLAVDAADNLFVDDTGSEVDEIAKFDYQPEENASLFRRICGQRGLHRDRC